MTRATTHPSSLDTQRHDTLAEFLEFRVLTHSIFSHSRLSFGIRSRTERGLPVLGTAREIGGIKKKILDLLFSSSIPAWFRIGPTCTIPTLSTSTRPSESACILSRERLQAQSFVFHQSPYALGCTRYKRGGRREQIKPVTDPEEEGHILFSVIEEFNSTCNSDH